MTPSDGMPPVEGPVPNPAPDLALSFAEVADAYDRARPAYPPSAVDWLVGKDAATVLELGAGTGKLTDLLLDRGHDVLATDPLEPMLSHLRARRPGCRTAVCSAEDLPVPSASVDVVVAAQSFHWFDVELALAEIARVLRPDGTLALVWNRRDERIPWVRKLGRILGSADEITDPIGILIASRLFAHVEDESFRFWQSLNKEQLGELVLSRSEVAVLNPADRERVLGEVDALFDEYDSGRDDMRMPYTTLCFKARVRPDLPHVRHPSDDLPAAIDDEALLFRLS